MARKTNPKDLAKALAEMAKQWSAASDYLQLAVNSCRAKKGGKVVYTMIDCDKFASKASVSATELLASIKKVEKLMAGTDKKSPVYKAASDLVKLAKEFHRRATPQLAANFKKLNAMLKQLEKVKHK